MYCPSCGFEHGTNTNYCKRCGVALNLVNTMPQKEPVYPTLKLTGAFWALAALGIIGVITLTIFYTVLYEEGARGDDLRNPFIFGVALIVAIAFVMGRLLAQMSSLHMKERNKHQPEMPPQPMVQPTGQVKIQSPGISYQAGTSVVEEATRRIPE
jgi:hypothetical protein